MALHSILPRLTSNMFYRVRYFTSRGRLGPLAEEMILIKAARKCKIELSVIT